MARKDSPGSTHEKCGKCGIQLELDISKSEGICRRCVWEDSSRKLYGNAPPSSRAYGQFRLSIIGRIFGERLTPRQVSEALAARAQEFPEISSQELRFLYGAGDTWPGGAQLSTDLETARQGF